MKSLSLMLAMLFLAFTVEAQNVSRTKKSDEKKTNKTSVRISSNKPIKAKVARVPITSDRSTSQSKSSSSMTSSAAKLNRTTHSSNARSSSGNPSKISERNTSGRSSSTVRTVSAQTRTSSNRTPQKAIRETSNRSELNSGTMNTNSQRNSNSKMGESINYPSRTSSRDIESRKVYTSNEGHRVNRIAPKRNYIYEPLEYRRVHYPYRRPNVIDIYWNANMYRNYRVWYPDFNLWYYPSGYRIQTISAYDAYNYVGEVARVYGQINEVWYSVETGEYYLYIGGPYPYQDFTVIIDARDAMRYRHSPEQFFTNRQIAVTGLVSRFEDKPEMFIKKRSQISLY